MRLSVGLHFHNILPPGPSGSPIVGNLFQLGKRPHQSLYALSLQYGPLMIVRLSMRTTMVVSSPTMAKEISKNMITSLLGGRPKRLEALQHLRRDQVFGTIRLIFEDKGKVVNIAHTVFCTTLNLLGNMIFNTIFFDPHDPDSAGFKDAICEMMKFTGKPNLVDFSPFLRFLDPQRLNREMARHIKALYDFVNTFIQKRLTATSQSVQRRDSEKDFLDVLLDSISDDFTLVGVRALIAELFPIGTETTTTEIEWVMPEFIHNPRKLN
ncbi:hypothetical protein SUGI_1163970 [Cryptomeria japonica]|nr:hypothetical protein SUGI_1163970 [Cryptomeria japonica]